MVQSDSVWFFKKCRYSFGCPTVFPKIKEVKETSCYKMNVFGGNCELKQTLFKSPDDKWPVNTDSYLIWEKTTVRLTNRMPHIFFNVIIMLNQIMPIDFTYRGYHKRNPIFLA